ncbi:MAG: hypothetical protein QGD94_08825 [Planctomycetia bacterium]|nr:hypothetical protein [Planctomycetia bacterium]
MTGLCEGCFQVHWFSRKKQPRLAERLLAEETRPWWEALSSRHAVVGMAIAAVFFIAALLIINVPTAPLPIKQGHVLQRPYVARVRFEYELHETTKDARDLARYRVAGIYDPKPAFLAKAQKDWSELLRACESAETLDELADEIAKQWKPDAAAFKELRKIATETARKDEVSIAVGEAFQKLKASDFLAILPAQQKEVERSRSERVDGLIAKLKNIADFARQEKYAYLLQDQEPGITVRFVQNDRYVLLKDVFTKSDSRNRGRRISEVFESSLSGLLDKKVLSLLVGHVTALPAEPTLTYAREPTENARVKESRISPIMGMLEPRTPIVEAGEEVTATVMQRIKAEHQAYLAGRKWHQRFLAWLGSGMLLALLIVLMTVYSLRFQTNAVLSNARAAVLCILCVVGIALARLAHNMGMHFDMAFVITFAMIVTIAYNARFALGATIALIFMAVIATKAGPTT